MINWYLFAAFSSVWAIFVLYAWVLSKRQARLQQELKDIQNRLQRESSSRPPQG